MNISKINLRGTNYDIKDKLVRDSIGIPASENNSLGIAPLDASGKVPSKNLPTIPQLPDFFNGHQYIDLGLPSGTLWATMNVGASSETDYGNYYKYGKGAAQYAATSGDSNYGGTEDPLDSSVDTASQVWGGSWHMPTRAQMQELTANTTYQWVTNYKGSGINGGTFTATNGAVLFIPAAGIRDSGKQLGVGNLGGCWGSSPNGSNNAYYLYFDDGGKDVYNSLRESGYSIRPVITLSNTLHKVSVTGDYNDLTNKPTIPNQISSYNAVSSNQSSISCSLSTTGCENKIYYNSGSSDITLGITTNANTIAVDGVDSITLGAGKYAEINFIRMTINGTTKIFIRSVSQ